VFPETVKSFFFDYQKEKHNQISNYPPGIVHEVAQLRNLVFLCHTDEGTSLLKSFDRDAM
jgi:hypothetical protein